MLDNSLSGGLEPWRQARSDGWMDSMMAYTIQHHSRARGTRLAEGLVWRRGGKGSSPMSSRRSDRSATGGCLGRCEREGQAELELQLLQLLTPGSAEASTGGATSVLKKSAEGARPRRVSKTRRERERAAEATAMEQKNGWWQGACRLLMGLGREGGEERGANGGKGGGDREAGSFSKIGSCPGVPRC